MIERFLLYRVDMECRDFAIYQIFEASSFIFVDTTKSDLILFELTVMAAELADDPLSMLLVQCRVSLFFHQDSSIFSA
jgi:hypothetical protein